MNNFGLNLYKVNLKGRGRSYYSLAKDPDQAYKIVREYLDRIDYGFSKDRELKSIEVVATYEFYSESSIFLDNALSYGCRNSNKPELLNE